jgi:excisionase family DNA binding protein
MLTVEEAAALLRMHPVSLRRLAKAGELPAARVGRWIFSHRLLLQWLEARMMAPKVPRAKKVPEGSALIAELTQQLKAQTHCDRGPTSKEAQS